MGRKQDSIGNRSQEDVIVLTRNSKWQENGAIKFRQLKRALKLEQIGLIIME